MISAFIDLVDKVDKHVPDVQVQLFHLHGVDRILHGVDRILHGVVRILHRVVRIFKLLNPLLKFRR